MQLRVYDVAQGSGNPSYLIGGTATAPWLGGPASEEIYRDILDIGTGTPAVPAVAGNLVERSLVAASNAGGANFAKNGTASTAFSTFSRGIVIKPAAAAGGQGLVRVTGVVYALCTTSGTAIANGTLLGADGAGNLTPIASPTPGQVVAKALGTLPSSTSTPTLVLVDLGSF